MVLLLGLISLKQQVSRHLSLPTVVAVSQDLFGLIFQ